MRKRVVFYGNCQLQVLARLLKNDSVFRDRYEVILASDHGLATIHGGPEVIAPFQYAKPDSEVAARVVAAVDGADVFVFQNFKPAPHINRPLEMTTGFLCERLESRQTICLPSFWFAGYFGGEGILNVLAWLVLKGLDAEGALDWLKNGSAPEIQSLKGLLVANSLAELERRERDEQAAYPCRIGVMEILSRFESRLLCYEINHPTPFYFSEIYRRLAAELGLSCGDPDWSGVVLPKGDQFPFLGDLGFFRRSYPDMENIEKYRGDFGALDLDFVNRSLKRLGEDRAKYLKGWAA